MIHPQISQSIPTWASWPGHRVRRTATSSPMPPGRPDLRLQHSSEPSMTFQPRTGKSIHHFRDQEVMTLQMTHNQWLPWTINGNTQIIARRLYINQCRQQWTVFSLLSRQGIDLSIATIRLQDWIINCVCLFIISISYINTIIYLQSLSPFCIANLI